MRVKNQNMAGRRMRLRFSGEYATFDDAGVADVPDKDGKFLTETPGWSRVGGKKARAAAPAPAPAPAAPPPAPSAFTPPAPAETRSAEPEPEREPEREDEPTVDFKTDPPPSPEPEEAEADGPDLDAMSKSELIETAEAYGVTLSYEQKRLKVADLRAHLASEIYEED